MASIHSYEKQGKEHYYVMYDVYVNGKRNQKKKKGFAKMKDAKAFKAKVENEINEGTYIDPSKMPFSELAEKWLKKSQIGLSKQTAKTYRIYLDEYVLPKFENTPISKITTEDIDDFINSMLTKKTKKGNIGYAPVTIKKAIDIMSSCFNYAIDHEYLKKNPCDKATLPKMTKSETNVWSEDEAKAFLDGVREHRLYCLFYIALHTGMRQGELLGLRWKDIDFKHKRLSIKQVMSHDAKEMYLGAKTEAGNRSIDLGSKALVILKEHKAKQQEEKLKYADIYKDQDLVFCTQYGTPVNPSNIRNRIMNPVIEETGVTQIRFHDLRHTCATILLLNGAPVKAVSERLGHSNIKVTLQTYAHVLPSTSQQIADQMDNLI